MSLVVETQKMIVHNAKITGIILIISIRNTFPTCRTQCDIRFLATLIIFNTIVSRANPV
jgi:hypothetical protein